MWNYIIHRENLDVVLFTYLINKITNQLLIYHKKNDVFIYREIEMLFGTLILYERKKK